MGGEEAGSGDRPVFGGNFLEEEEETMGLEATEPQCQGPCD